MCSNLMGHRPYINCHNTYITGAMGITFHGGGGGGAEFLERQSAEDIFWSKRIGAEGAREILLPSAVHLEEADSQPTVSQ